MTFDLSGLPHRPVTRFAPSPTGSLHLGHVANALWTWGVTRALDGTVLLRIEDHDRGRCRPAFEADLLEDLAWLGFHPDNGPPVVAASPSLYRQSDNAAVYEDALAGLARCGLVYGCRCSRRSIAGALGGQPPDGEELRYPGTCDSLALDPAPPRGARVRLGPHAVSFVDGMVGLQSQLAAAQCGDVLARDARGWWTYQFSVVVDDLRHGVTLVIRGEDLLASTGRQILLGALLGRATSPAWLHHPLIRDAAGIKLSKRGGAAGLRELRENGASAPEVIGRAAHRTGLLDRPEPVPADEVASLFSAVACRPEAPPTGAGRAGPA